MTGESCWFGELPRGWAAAPVGARYSVQLGKMLNPEAVNGPNLAPYLRNVDIQWDRINTADLPEMSFSADERLKFALRPGDVLVCEGGEVGRAAIWKGELSTCLYQKALHRLRPLRATEEPRFLVYVLRAAVDRGVFEAEGNRSTIYHLTAEMLRAHRLPFPPLDRQRSIAASLDRRTAVIDQLVEKKERLIELLQKKRQALITQAVTKGLNPGLPMKDSGVAWLGRIPAHWHVMRVKHVAKLESGHTPDRSNPDYWRDDNDIPWVSLNDTRQLAQADYISDTALHVNPLGIANSSARLLPARVVVFTRDATIGEAAITTRPMAVSQHVIAWVCGSGMLPEYLLRVFYVMKPELDRYTFGATLRTIGMSDVKTLVTTVPPVPEQRQIVAFLESEVGTCDATLRKVGRQIELLREYRMTLISAAVTGQIDVGNEAA